ncbi:HNH endonuclease [Raoultella ornithinolytica]|uniref:HNH endonuclease n=1 Tax=Raoultella ornithinolytica TaxID=54291 RepID=UPI003D994747
MINRPIVYSVNAQAHVNTFNGDATHWDGTCTVRKNFRKEVRDYYRDEQGFICPYCGRLREEFHGGQWDIDHIIPKSSYPEYLYTPRNLAVTCKDCNTYKSKDNPLLSPLAHQSPYPNNSEYYKIIHPHFDLYDDHIRLTRDRNGRSCHEVITDKGRETFNVCNLIRFSEALSGTSEYIPELGVEIGITDEFSESVQMLLADYDALTPDDAEIALQALIQRRNLR